VKPRLLFVEDDARYAESFTSAVAPHYDIVHLNKAELILDRVSVERFEAVVLDLYLKPGMMNGFELLELLVVKHPWLPVLLLTSEEKADTIVHLMQKGAAGYMPKTLPFDEILNRIDHALERTQLRQRARSLEGQIREERPFISIRDPRMQEVEVQLLQVAPYDSTVLLHGESGTGKSVLAREIHINSRRKDKIFQTLDCSVIQENLLGSALFGTVRGAYTEAPDRPGFAESCHGGTLFLDEVDKLDLSVQRMLLRLVEEKTICRLGSTQSLKVDIRLIVASSKKLEDMVSENRFLAELYNRLKVFRIHIPSLREMPSAIPQLVEFYTVHLCKSLHRAAVGIDTNTMSCLQAASWPGNIRELRNAIESALIRCDGPELMPWHLPDELRSASESEGRGLTAAANKAADQARRQLILESLARHDWQVVAAAKELDIVPAGLRHHMRRLGIARPGKSTKD